MIRHSQRNDRLIKPAMAFEYKTRSPYFTTMANPAGVPAKDRFRKVHQADHDSGSSLPPIPNKKRQQQQQQQQHQQQQQTPNGFLLRLMAIDEKHEKKRQAKERDVTEKQTEFKDNAWKLQQRELGYNVNESRDRWISGQILVDGQDTRLSLGGLGKPHDDSRLPLLDTQRTTSPNEAPSISLVTKEDDIQSGRVSPSDDVINSDDCKKILSVKKKPLRLPPLLLPPICSVRPRPLKQRDFLTPTRVRGPVADSEWEELLHCRYIRHAPSRFALDLTPSQSPFHW